MMKVADVTGVAWQQMCVSSWQGLAASPVSGGGRTYSSVLGVCVFLFVFASLTLSDRQFLLLAFAKSSAGTGLFPTYPPPLGKKSQSP